MVRIDDRTLYRRCSIKSHEATAQMVRVGARVYDRSKQRVIITTPERRIVVTGPCKERCVYSEEEFVTYYAFDMNDQKKAKKLNKGKVMKVTANEGAGNMYFLRVPANEQFLLYDEFGAPVIGNARNFALDHAEGDCIICPVAADGGPDLSQPHLVIGKDFSEKYNG